MKGILFTPENVKLCAEGIKTVTRRTHGLEAINEEPDKWENPIKEPDGNWLFINNDGEAAEVAKSQYREGETVYIKETYATEKAWDDKPMSFLSHASDVPIWYQVNDPLVSDFVPRGKWRSPMFMPAWAARHFRKITNVRVERLKDITPEDCLKEGIKQVRSSFQYPEYDVDYITPQAAYFAEWDMLNGKKDKGIYLSIYNPWLFRYELLKVERPV